MRKRVRSRLTLHSAAAPLIVFWCVQFSFAQSNDPFSIRVESNQVLVRAQAFRNASANLYYVQCMLANWELSFNLPLSEPYIADQDCVKDFELNDLRVTDFHVLEDGVEQTLSSLFMSVPLGL
ncbi:MAG TPA: hypothetical protein VG897_19345 [Terriglobales bacterium]|nr:hypothetical protein [Terriglobales bacterium]